ncbi:MAG: ferredoxin [Puniceicoccaceae bacterium]|nr:MAG: ferredoxin [Puniceicoccaceae bacterium]
MTAPAQTDLVTVVIDGKEIAVPKGTNIIEAASRLGIEIPHYCYHPKLSVVGNCRMCLVEMGMPMIDRGSGKPILDDHGGQKIGWMPRPAIACATAAVPGMQIRTTTELVKQCREGVMEFLLVNHPLDCPICDQAGECRLQEFATDYGRGYSRFIEEKNVKPKRTRLGPRVMLDDERCILCSRCIRFCQEVPKDDVLGFVDRGSYSTLTCYPGKQLENNYSLNTVDICPVGALTSTDFRFKMRVWFLKQTPSIDTESSVGANTFVWAREGKIYRITPRRNDAVNDTWMADSGRELYQQVEAEDRLNACHASGKPVPAPEALQAAVALLKEGKTAIVGSARASLEEQFLLKKVARAAGGAPVHLVAHTGEGDGLLVSADRTPNLRGALLTGLIDTLPPASLEALGAAIDAGEVQTLVVVREDLLAAGLTEAQLERVRIIHLDTHRRPGLERAAVVLAGLTVFEKAGSFVNQQFRVQKFQKAVPGPGGAAEDLFLLATLAAELGGESMPSTPASVWQAMAAEIAAFRGMTFAGIPDDGVVVEAGRLAELPFVEGESLHYKPAAEAAGV